MLGLSGFNQWASTVAALSAALLIQGCTPRKNMSEQSVEWHVVPGTNIRYTTPYYSLKAVLEDGFEGTLVAVDAPNIEKDGKLFVIRQKGNQVLVPKGLIYRGTNRALGHNSHLVMRIENQSGVVLFDHFDETKRVYEEAGLSGRDSEMVFTFRRAEIKKG
jgi:hypothetical protein